jgi:hypothetical protein
VKVAFRFLPYCYIALALVCTVAVAMVLRSVIVAYQIHDDDFGTPLQLVPLFTFSALGVALTIAFVANGALLFRRRRRKFSVVLAVVGCLAFPIGTMLGAITIFILTREEIRNEYV